MVINLTDADLQILDRALQALPYRDVAGLINKINHQLNEQQPIADNSIDQKESTIEATAG